MGKRNKQGFIEYWVRSDHNKKTWTEDEASMRYNRAVSGDWTKISWSDKTDSCE